MIDLPPNPDPGVYRDVSFESYKAIRLPNSGAVSWGLVSMAHMRAAIDGLIADSDSTAKRFGRAEHCMVLEPEQFESRFLVASKCVGTVKSRPGEICGYTAKLVSPHAQHAEDQYRQAEHILTSSGFELRHTSESGSRYYQHGARNVRVSDHAANESTTEWIQACGAADIRVGSELGIMAELECRGLLSGVKPLNFWFCAKHEHVGCVAPQDFINEGELQRLHKIRDSLHTNELLSRVRKPGWSEVTIIFDWLGVRWKGRIDRLPDDLSVLYDLKSCESGCATPDDMQQAVKTYGFHRQMVLYMYGVAILKGMQPDGAWVFAEKSEPFGVNILHIDKDTMSIAEHEIETVAKRWRKAVETGVYPGYLSSASDVRRGGLPEGYRRHKLQEIGASA